MEVQISHSFYTKVSKKNNICTISQGFAGIYKKIVQNANLKYKFGNRHFWAEGYYVSTVGLNEETIRKYIKEQEKHDMAMDKLSVKEYEDPFK